ncbi:MAG: TonB-dependent receptor [Sphingomonadales bacterium]|nr:TonB-dependent receptor [Sphingomonadales bacterium]MDE2568385.1 TonB-dependent receptor [Sphingomonadales bacterium]
MIPLAAASAAGNASGTSEKGSGAAVVRDAAERQAEPDDDDGDAVQPDSPIVVTAKRLDAARTEIDAELGATAYSLDNDTIEDRPGGETGSIGAILTQTPGVTLSSSGLKIRGSGAIQVRINNVVVPEAISDPADRLSSRFAATTRVITGTLPAQFGFSPGGVVSVTTKNGLYQHGGQLEMFAGNHGMIEPALEWSGSTGSTSLFTSGSYETGTSQVTDGAGLSARERRHEFGGIAFADNVLDSENRLSLIAGGSTERRDFGPTSIGPAREANDSGYLVGTWQHSTDAFTLQASLFGGEALGKVDFASRQRLLRGSIGTQVDTSYRVGGANTVRAGLFVDRTISRLSVPGTAVVSSERTSVAAYLQDQIKLTPSFAFNAGARVDWLRGLGSAATFEPRASLVWTGSGGLSLHAGYARYAAAPPLGETASATPLSNERDDYVDAGVQQRVGAFTLGIEGYWRSAHNLIAERAVPGEVEPGAFEYRRGRFGGIEFSATYGTPRFDAWANLSISRSRGRGILADPALISPATIAAVGDGWIALASDRPVSGSAGLTWHLDRLSLSADMVAVSGAVTTTSSGLPNGARASAYASLGLSAIYHLRLFGRSADVRADITNLTGAHYLTNDAANLEGGWTRRDPGRGFLIGIEQAF